METEQIIAVSGAEGFIGSFVVNELEKRHLKYLVIPRNAWEDPVLLELLLAKCGRFLHFAGLSRHEDGSFLYRENMLLVEKIVSALRGKNCRVFFASSPHVLTRDLPYHRSKRDGMRMLLENHISAVPLYLPNTFGPGGKPFYNSVVATFAYLAANGKVPDTINDVILELIPVRTLAQKIVDQIDRTTGPISIEHTINIPLKQMFSIMQNGGDDDGISRLFLETVNYFKQKNTV